ncbi:hypothetical protein GALMADRAFT_216617 [Galerina marginata CBS 339.88]|uniref:Uncharacterized protein n=1 Tax=Galerina marginata (strain CBS 339.88) TaxID=685588 RepID=A0A067SK27_GALM3|nr:hypothetical protein GALMADRAFT_216617 [Galerina marginata CBS 339.88]
MEPSSLSCFTQLSEAGEDKWTVRSNAVTTVSRVVTERKQAATAAAGVSRAGSANGRGWRPYYEALAACGEEGSDSCDMSGGGGYGTSESKTYLSGGNRETVVSVRSVARRPKHSGGGGCCTFEVSDTGDMPLWAELLGTGSEDKMGGTGEAVTAVADDPTLIVGILRYVDVRMRPVVNFNGLVVGAVGSGFTTLTHGWGLLTDGDVGEKEQYW